MCKVTTVLSARPFVAVYETVKTYPKNLWVVVQKVQHASCDIAVITQSHHTRAYFSRFHGQSRGALCKSLGFTSYAPSLHCCAAVQRAIAHAASTPIFYALTLV